MPISQSKRIYFDFFSRSPPFPFAFLFTACFVAHFMVFTLNEILVGFLSKKGKKLISKEY